MARLEILVSYNPDPRLLRKLLERHNGRIIAVAILLEVENPGQKGAIMRHYGLKPLEPQASLFITLDSNE